MAPLPQRLLTSLLTFAHQLLEAIANQARLLFSYFNPVKTDTLHLTYTRLSFAPAFLFLLAFYLRGLYGLGPQLAFHRAFDPDYYRTDPYIYYHLLYEPSNWPARVVLYSFSDILLLLTLACTFVYPPLSLASCLLLRRPGQQPVPWRAASDRQQTETVMVRLAAFHRTERRLLTRAFTLYFIYNQLDDYWLIYHQPITHTPRIFLHFAFAFAFLASPYKLFRKDNIGQFERSFLLPTGTGDLIADRDSLGHPEQ